MKLAESLARHRALRQMREEPARGEAASFPQSAPLHMPEGAASPVLPLEMPGDIPVRAGALSAPKEEAAPVRGEIALPPEMDFPGTSVHVEMADSAPDQAEGLLRRVSWDERRYSQPMEGM